ncbi:MAG: HTH-type transcriptional repressor YtrA [bacterium ADurb.Bin157]|jgi:GntR family transcriptional regulator|nr:MAG: HTH-type transcriptional repressor YtrA [bacterium ADurb.Bin157]
MIIINDRSPIPIYRQIVEALRREIFSGVYEPDSRFPSIRELSAELKVNPATISKAFQELESDNLIYFKRGQGAFVTPQNEDKVLKQIKIEIMRKIEEIVKNSVTMGLSRAHLKNIFETVLDNQEVK